MKGNFQVRFLGEGAVVMPLPYPTPQRSIATDAGSRSQGGKTRPVGATRSPADAALGMATWRERKGRASAGFKRPSRYRFRWVHLRQQAALR